MAVDQWFSVVGVDNFFDVDVDTLFSVLLVSLPIGNVVDSLAIGWLVDHLINGRFVDSLATRRLDNSFAV